MALRFIKQYAVPFQSTPGENATRLSWELDILRSYDDQKPDGSFKSVAEILAEYPWISYDGTKFTFPAVTSLVGTGSPIKIQWERDNDVYKPIIGSKASINLNVQTAGQYADFSSTRPYEYQARLSYYDSNDIIREYWNGMMTSLDGKENVGTFPFVVSFSATDGLGLLGQSSVPLPTETVSEVLFWDTLKEAIYQTGLNLDIYIDSGIRTSSSSPVTIANGLEALTSISGDGQWTNKETSGTITRKEAIEGVLSALNCTIKQSYGRFYITNASTHGGTGTAETTSFDVWEVSGGEYVKRTANATEDLLYTIDGTSTQSLVPVNEDLVKTTRRPYGSVECRPKGLYAEDIKNGGFELLNSSGLPVGWSPGPTEGPLKTSTTIRQAGTRSLFTNHNTFEINTANDVWFTNTNGVEVDGSGSFEVSFDWLTQLLVTEDCSAGAVRNAILNWEVYFVPDVPRTLQIIPSGWNPLNYLLPDSITSAAYFYDNEAATWTSVSNIGTYNFESTKITTRAGEDDLGFWLAENTTFPPIYTFDVDPTDSGVVGAGPGKLYVRFYFPQANRAESCGKGKIRDNGDDLLNVYIDNLSAKNVFSNEIADPVFERIQDDFTETYKYTPRIGSGINDALIQTVTQKEYIRKGNTDDEADNLTLEQIGTQQKLNDFKISFPYFEGNLLNLTQEPLAPHHRVFINWNNYTPVTCTINGGTFDVKRNQFDVSMYVPNQATDIAPGNGVITGTDAGPGFYNMNVDLIPMPFPGRNDNRTYSLNVYIIAKDAGDVTIADGLVPLQKSYQWTGTVGQRIPIEIIADSKGGYVANSNTTDTADDTTSTPFPSALSEIMYTNNGGQLRINATLTIPDNPDIQYLHVDGRVTAFDPEVTPGITAHTITFSLDPTLTGISTDAGDPVYPFDVVASGVAGDRKTIVHTIKASDGRFVENIDETHSESSLSPGVITGNGTQAATIVFDYDVPSTLDNPMVTITGSTRGATGIGTTPITKTLTITNNITGLTIVDGTTSLDGVTTTIPFVGIAGQEITRNITCDPPSDQYISSLTTSLEAGDITVGTPYVSGEDWEIPVIVEIVNDSVQPSFTIGGELKEEPYSLTFVPNDLGLNNAAITSISWTDSMNVVHDNGRQTFDEGNFVSPNDDIDAVSIKVSTIGNYSFNNSTDIQVDVNEAAVVINGNETVVLPESQFTASRSTPDSNGDITITITGKFPTKGGQYVLDVNILGNTNAQGTIGALQNPASIGPDPDNPLTYIRSLTPGISSAGGVATFEVVANGAWNANLTVATQGGTDEDNDTGSFNIDVGPATDVTLLNVKGSYSPTTGGEGTHLITLETGEEPMYLRPGGPPATGLATTYFSSNGVTYVLRLYARNPDGSDGASPLIGNNVRQSQEFGGRTYEVPAGWDGTETSLIAASVVKDTWTFYI